MSGIDYTVVYSNRKTIAINIKPDVSVVVKAPKWMKKSAIDAFVKRYAEWIEKKRRDIVENNAERESFNFSDGQKLMLFGRMRVIAQSYSGEISFDSNYVYIPKGSESERREIYRDYLRNMAKREFEDRVKYYSEIMNVRPVKISITAAKTRWGSCSVKNSLNFSLYSMALPHECIDLIVVHELSHIFVHNHSKEFYDVVEKHIPNHRELREHLKEIGRLSHIWENKN